MHVTIEEFNVVKDGFSKGNGDYLKLQGEIKVNIEGSEFQDGSASISMNRISKDLEDKIYKFLEELEEDLSK